eukprot:TRINITY_DN775_c0_g1_i4.p1 TRINITY_DN775_c0_g1~~TRINITY_DN775_c0_g1_i4.p1  ORF type:complete len:436 (+),score=110.89 TRINITY_DN775_c0_g1_i4:129-1436(+)
MASSAHPTPRPPPPYVNHTHSDPSSTPLSPSRSLSLSQSSSPSPPSASSSSASSSSSSSPPPIAPESASEADVSGVSVSMTTGETTTFEMKEEETYDEEEGEHPLKKKKGEKEKETEKEKEYGEYGEYEEEEEEEESSEEEKKPKKRHPFSGQDEDLTRARSPSQGPTPVTATPSTLALLRVGPRLIADSADVKVPPMRTDAVHALQNLEKVRWNWNVGEFRKHVLKARRALLGEFVGTALLVWFVCGAVVSEVFRQPSIIPAGTVFAVAVSSLVFALWNISGGQLNPAVTLALASTGRISLISGIAFILVQLLGCALGAGLLYLTFPETAASSVHYGATHLGNLSWELDGIIYTATVEAWQGLLVEIIATFTLVFVTFCVADIQGDSKHMGKLAPLAIGLSVFCGVAVAGPLSGGSLNPARSLVRIYSAFHSIH